MGEKEQTIVRIAKYLASIDFPISHWSYLDLRDKQILLDEANRIYEGIRKAP